MAFTLAKHPDICTDPYTQISKLLELNTTLEEQNSEYNHRDTVFFTLQQLSVIPL